MNEQIRKNVFLNSTVQVQKSKCKSNLRLYKIK